MKYTVKIYQAVEIGDKYVGKVNNLSEQSKNQLVNLMRQIGYDTWIEEEKEENSVTN